MYQLISLIYLVVSICAQQPYGPSQLGQYGRILQTGNLYGFGQLQEAIQHGTLRGLADIEGQPRLQGLPPLPMTHDEVIYKLTSTLPPPSTKPTAKPTPPTIPTISLNPYGVNNVPELPPKPESRLNGYFDDDGNFHSNDENKKQVENNDIEDSSLELATDNRKSKTKREIPSDYHHKKPQEVSPYRRQVHESHMPTHQGLETLKSNGVKRPRQVAPRAPVYASTLPPRPTYPPFVFRPKPSPIGRDQADSNLLAEIEEYDDFLEQSLAYKAQYPQATIPNPYWFLPDGKLPRAGTHYLSQTSQPQAFGAALQQAVPQQNIIMPQYDAKGQTVVQTPQAQNNYQPYQQQQQQQQYQNNYYGQQQQGQQYGQQSITPSVAAPAAAASALSASSAPDPLANPLLSLLNLFNFNTPSTGTAGATSQAHGVTTLVDVQQNPISFPTMGQTNMFGYGK